MLNNFLKEEMENSVNKMVSNKIIDCIMRGENSVSFNVNSENIELYTKAISTNVNNEDYVLFNIGDTELIVKFN